MSSSSYSYSPVEGSLSGITSLESGSRGELCPRKNENMKRPQHSSAYVPHNRLSRYTTALFNLVPVRFKRVPGSEIPLDKIGLFSSVSFNWLNEYITAGCKNGAKDKPMPSLAKLDSCQVNGTRIDGLWHNHVVERGQAGASVPRIAWQFVKTRVLIASFIYFLGMIISFCSPIIVLQQIVSTTEDRLLMYTKQMNDTTKNYTLSQNETLTNLPNQTIAANASIFNTNNTTNVTTLNGLTDKLSESFSHLIVVDEVIIFTNIGILIVAEIVSIFLYSWSSSMNLRTATRLRSACLAVAYKKLVRSSIRYQPSAHEVMTYFVPSSKTLYELIANGPLIFSGPLILLLWSLFMLHAMGRWSFVGIVVIITLYSCLVVSAYLTKMFGTRAVNYSLRRISLLQEYIDNAFLAKVTLWDNYFFKKIQEIRRKELGEMRLGGLSEGWSLSMVHVIPIVTVSATLMACMLTNQQIQAKNYIPWLVLILINLKYCIRNSWLAISSISRGIISLNKLKTVLTLKDTDRFADKPIDKNLAVTINHGHFNWQKDKSVSEKSSSRGSQFYLENNETQTTRTRPARSLTDINFYAPKSKLIGICGSCDSGKSSLLLSLMGHLNNMSGHVTIDGSCSYVSQVPWLFEGTLKENVLFGESLDSSWYYKTIRSCNLTEDIALLPGSDDTDLSTVNLTLAQKQKIVLARAVYAQRDINLLDNPLADVEPEEAKDIFEKSIVHALGSKTVIMVSDRVQFLIRCDNIYVMKEGAIIEQGTHEELLQWKSEYTNLLDSYIKKHKNKYCRSGEQINVSMSQLLTTPTPRGILTSTSTSPSSILDTDEEMIAVETQDESEGPIRSTIYEKGLQIRDSVYMNVFGGWHIKSIIVSLAECFSFPIAFAPLVFIDIGQRTISGNENIAIALSGMIGFLLVSGIILLVLYNRMVFRAAKRMHERWLQGLFSVEMSFLATVPSSILLNICSLNIQEVDSVLPRLMTTILMHGGIVMFSLVVIGLSSIYLLIPIILFILASVSYIFYARGLTLSLHETVHADSVIPMYNHSVNTISGRAVIQAYHKEREFTKKFYRYCDNNSTIDFMLYAIKLWIEFRIKMLSALTLGVVVLMCASLTNIRDRYEILGLAFICTLQIALSIVQMTGAFTSAYASLVTIDAVDDYVEHIPKEKECTKILSDDWPSEHSIKFDNVVFSTKTHWAPLNLSIESGEKVALMGVEPTLKSLFVTSLYRFVEINSGEIYLSKKNIADVSTEKLRKSINFIPGHPVLFQGSIRYNLDPENEKTDKALIMALQTVFLWEKVSKLPEKLESSSKAFFSLWERKLFFLARALLNTSSKIIIVEESAERLGSDEDIVDKVLLEAFTDYTIIALSSRRVRYAKKICYFEDGKLIETPTRRSDSSSPNIVDLSISVPKNIIQTSF